MNMSLQSLWSRNPGGWSAIDLQGGLYGVNVSLPRQAGQKPVVLQHAAFAGQSVDGPVLAQMARSLSGAKFGVVALLERHDYHVYMVDKPAVRPDEMDSSLRLAVSPMLDFPVEQANLAWLDIPVRQTQGGRVQQLYVVVARTEKVDGCKGLFDQARLRLDAVDVRETAQRNMALLLDSEKSATCLIFADAEGVQLTVTWRGELYLVRFINEALLGKPEQDRAPVSEAMDRLALEIQRSFDFVRRNYPALNIDTLHVAPTEVDIGLAQTLKKLLIEDVQALDLASLFDFPAGSDLQQAPVQARYFHALGSALRIHSKE